MMFNFRNIWEKSFSIKTLCLSIYMVQLSQTVHPQHNGSKMHQMAF